MGLITSAGIGSGLDVESIISALLDAERAPKEASFVRLESQASAQISGIGKLKSALSTLQDAIGNLTEENFNARTASVPTGSELSATASATASSGSFDVTIDQTAEFTELSTGTIAGDSSTVLGSGNLTIQNTNGDSFSIAVGASDTLLDIVYAFNNATDNFGVSATIVNGDSGTKIIYRGEDTGALNDFTVTNDNANLAQISDGNGGTLNVDSTAVDAQITIAGLTITSDTNTFSQPVQGVDITLDANATLASVVTVTVDKDPDTVKENIQKFVDDYNAYITVANQLGDTTPGAQGELVGDSTLRQITRQISSTVSTTVASSAAAFNSLSLIGISTQTDGTLSLNSSDLDSLLATNFDDVGNVFFATDGIGTIIDAAVNPYTQFAGFLDSRKDSLQTTLTRIDDEREKLDYRINQLEISLRSKYAAMDSLVSQFNFTGSFLTQQFDALSKSDS